MGFEINAKEFDQLADNPNDKQLETIRAVLMAMARMNDEEKAVLLIEFTSSLMKQSYRVGYIQGLT
jgi:hypothetical protein